MKIFQISIIFVCFSLVFTNCDDSKSSAGAESLLALGLDGSGFLSSCDLRNPETGRGIFVADEIVSAPTNNGIGFKDSDCSVDGIRGQGKFNGSLDVYSIEDSGSGSAIILRWSGAKVLPTSGIDFIVYENPFFIGVQNDSNTFNNVFMEPLIVEVGNDLANWCGWDPEYTNSDPNTFVGNPIYWERFAGITPFSYNQDTNPMTVPEVFDTDIVNGGGGGDGFDLADSNFGNSGTGCTGGLKTDIQANGFTYIKISAAKTILTSLPIDPAHANPDIDGVIAKSVTP
ncbi:LIC_13355 family lipoprotein [Leptospira andrefontaineae]|uniref:LIC_13355 family lipoprotein n=1 Tax=Leptospira andrefontaineae TaxID=2484976 RepID=A0A4R9H0T1_9LEPT|nr:LIC_13355 family lipoprotein [Leptospira andrefontaineae]TGK37907.1 LIC_13355 family lipoprotein [Leptospira andrefontaineae]